MEHCLQIDSVIKHFENKIILSDIYIELKTKDIIGIHGRNGSGKSTLFNIIYGIGQANQSIIRYNNKTIKRPFKRKQLIAYSTQKCFLPKNIYVKHILKLFVNDDLLNNCLSIFNSIKDTKVIDLSGGEKKLLQTYLILNTDAKFILLDEPFSKLSPLMIENLCELITQKSKTKGILICDHNFEKIFKISNKNYLLKNGSLKNISSIDNYIEQQYLI